jgi:hypothetical protein
MADSLTVLTGVDRGNCGCLSIPLLPQTADGVLEPEQFWDESLQ